MAEGLAHERLQTLCLSVLGAFLFVRKLEDHWWSPSEFTVEQALDEADWQSENSDKKSGSIPKFV